MPSKKEGVSQAKDLSKHLIFGSIYIALGPDPVNFRRIVRGISW